MVHISRTEIVILFVAVMIGYVVARVVREVWQSQVITYLASAAAVVVAYFGLVALLRWLHARTDSLSHEP